MDIRTVGLAVGAAFLVTLGMHFVLLPLARCFGLLDHPNARKKHGQPVPIIGGLAMLAGGLAALCTAAPTIGPRLLAFVVASLVLIVVGLLDDRHDVSWRVRILAQVVAALIMVYVGGVRVEHLGRLFGFDHFLLGVLAVPFTVFATVGTINAVNMVDGLDGLAGSLVTAAFGMLGAAAIYAGNASVAAHAFILAAAVAAFLLFNLHFPRQARARVFMGNAGSAFLGLAIAWIALRLTQNAGHPVSPALGLWLLPVPLIDCLVLMVRRFRQGRSPFAADRTHVHHLMLEAGFTPMGIVATLVGFSLASGLLAGIVLKLHVPMADQLLVVSFFAACGAWYWLTARRARVLVFLRAVRRGPRRRELRTGEPVLAEDHRAG